MAQHTGTVVVAVYTKRGRGDVVSVMVGGANVLNLKSPDDLTAALFGLGNVVTQINPKQNLQPRSGLSGANVLTSISW